MKKIKLAMLFLAGFGLVTVFHSCDEQLEQPSANAPASAQLSESSVENEIMYYMSILNDGLTMTISDLGDEQFEYKIHASPAGDKAKAIVCKGAGISFANCVNSWLQSNPGSCLRIYIDQGTYYADDDC